MKLCRQGGGIAAAFATSFPKLVQGKLVLISPAGLVKVDRNASSQTLS